MGLTPFGRQFAAFCRSVTAKSRFRLAPTPSGFLHAGNALNFILNHRAARSCPGARILLRIDDLDADRKRPEYVQDVFDTLAWLGLDYDEGPGSAADFEQNWSQWRRMDQYEAALGDLRARGVLFACRKSRKELAEFGGRYPVEFREQGIGLDEPDCSWRIAAPENLAMGDFVLRRRDGIPAYQIASLVDDLHFGITHIIRGEDLAPSTEAQLFLAQIIEKQAFKDIYFLHHPLIADESGVKLSKSAGAASLKAMRERGQGPELVYELVERMLG